ncbi:MAG: hypothetical protein KF764_01275 [Labilithrix sp.]|nr:hypothetical protein [Labilithrix sp.]MBX3222060.1 hypothetical protein [Labilithrix sp.]
MRLFSKAASLLLLTGALASAAALANCAAAPDDDGDEALSDEEINGANNRMGLRLIYDEPSGTVRATVKKRLRAGEQLRLRVRRGRLSSGSQRELSCRELPEAPALPPVEDTSESGSASAKVVYQGPAVDPSLLVSVYDERWIQGNITPEMLDRLAREGADSIVEACIVKGDLVRARLQTSVAYAWDESDPNLGSAGVDRLSFEDGLQFNAGDAGGGSAGRPRAGRPIQSMEKYAELCVAELGDIPFFKKQGPGKYDTFDCRDFVGGDGDKIAGVEGALIPQEQHDENGADTTPRECDDRSSSRYNCFKTCDKPEWLFQSCEPGPTVTTAKNDKGTHWTLLCRSTGARGASDDTRSLLETKVFNDIAMIGHNPKTGKTCFFQNKIFDGTDGAHVPHPADLEKSRHVWDAPKGYCMRCHSAEAFIHSPWIDGAKRRDGTPIVPMMGKHADFEISWNSSPFSVVNRKAQADARVGGGSWDLPKHLVSEGADACLTCHRIGGGDGMRRFPMWAAGEEGLDRFAQGTSGPIFQRYSPQAQKFENSHWMPLRLEGLNADNWAESKYGKAVAHIKACAENGAAPECEWADVPDR